MKRLLYILLVVVLNVVFPIAVPSASAATTEAHTVVIGSGISGLAAASHLTALLPSSSKIIVLESTDRVGGRLHTLQDHFTHPTDGTPIPVDLGGAWIHGTENNPLTELATTTISPPLTHLTTNYDNSAYFDAGALLSSSAVDAIYADFEEVLSIVEQQQDSDTELPLSSVWDAAYADLSFTDAQQRYTNYQAVNEIELSAAASISSLSHWWWNSDSAFGGPDWLFPGGYNQITNYLATDLQIVNSDPVVSIDRSSSTTVVVTTASGESYSASNVIVTLPLGVLQKGGVAFTPPLPADIQSAIADLQMGVLDKNVLQFPSNFWDSDPSEKKDFFYNIGVGSSREELAPYLENLNFDKYVPGSNLLCVFDSGDTAIANSELDEATRVDAVMDKIRIIWPDAPDPTNYKLTSWWNNENSYGSYSYLATGSSPDSRKAFTQGVDGKLFFAGEHSCVDMASTAHGAYMSGLDAADRVAGVLKAARCMSGAGAKFGAGLLGGAVLAVTSWVLAS